jgi:hypothetical protein
MVVFVYHKTKCITLFYLLSAIMYSTTHYRIFCRILSGYNREIWYIFGYGRILTKPYFFPYPLITSRIPWPCPPTIRPQPFLHSVSLWLVGWSEIIRSVFIPNSCSYRLIIFIKLLANVPVVLLLHQKAKGSLFIINMTSGYRPEWW